MESNAIKSITADTFEQEVLQSDTPVLVDFWAEWCEPCKRLAPVLEKIATEMPDKIKIVKLNIDEYPQFNEKYKIHSIPNMQLFAKGEFVDGIIGFAPEPTIRTEVNRLLDLAAGGAAKESEAEMPMAA